MMGKHCMKMQKKPNTLDVARNSNCRVSRKWMLRIDGVTQTMAQTMAWIASGDLRELGMMQYRGKS